MKPHSLFILFLLFFFSVSSIIAQETEIFLQTFSESGLPPSWDAIDANGNGANWEWTATGRATGGQYWEDRPAIASNSGVPGAYMLNSDSAATAGIPYEHHAFLVSPFINCSSNDEVWLQFYEYYRSGQTRTTVGVSIDDGATWVDFPINEAIGFGTETQNDAFVEIDISAVAANEPNVQVRFEFEGINYFWIIDDVRLVQPETNNPGFPQTFPTELGDSLSSWEIPYLIDSLGGAYPPNELVIKWVDGTPEPIKEQVRNDLGVARFDTCSCSELELFIFPTFLTAADNLLTNGDFSQGDTGFTSELSSDCMCNSDSYCIGREMVDKCSNFSAFNFEEFLDPGIGQFMIVDGATTPSTEVWCNTVNLSQGDDYVFTFRAREDGNDQTPILQLKVGTQVIGANTIGTIPTWEEFTLSFQHTQGDGNYDVCLEQVNSGFLGYDYGLDDLFMANLDSPSLTYQDSIEEKKDKSKSMPAEIEEVDFNYYNFDIEELKDTLPLVSNTFPVNENTQMGDEGNDQLIAILDTGIDYNYAYNTASPTVGFLDINPYMWQSPNTETCYPGDDKGWNFVHFNDNDKKDKPFDDHGHGTHVAGIVIQQWERFRVLSDLTLDNCCQLKLLPVKTHDFHGLGKLFDVSCGIVYATEMGADVINASWGFTAVQDPDSGVLHYAIDRANSAGRNVLFVTSAGNSGVDIDSPVGAPLTPNYPSNFDLNNTVTVAALEEADNRWSFSNFSSTTVHYAVPGVGVFSAIPQGASIVDPLAIWEPKSGTSMAAPVVSAYSGVLFCMDANADEQIVKTKLNNYAVPTSADWSNLSITGKKMDEGTFIANLDFQQCITGLNESLSPAAEVLLFPNPTTDFLNIQVRDNLVPIRLLSLSDGLGRTVWQERISGPTTLNRQIDLSQLPSGIYQMSIFTDNGIQGFSVLRE